MAKDTFSGSFDCMLVLLRDSYSDTGKVDFDPGQIGLNKPVPACSSLCFAWNFAFVLDIS
jgi:hypothetical protein